jgi:hypothetical protein
LDSALILLSRSMIPEGPRAAARFEGINHAGSDHQGIPLRIKGTSGRGGTTAGVDSELTLLYRRLTGVETPLVGPLANPYFLADTPIAQAKPFSHQASTWSRAWMATAWTTG